jgi:hypothetical protein
MRYAAIDSLRERYPVSVLCDVLAVSTSGYYEWRSRPVSARQLANERLVSEIRILHAESFGTYGSPRIHASFQRQGRSMGKERIRRLMQENQIVGRHRKKRCRTTDSNHALPTAPNLLQQNFACETPNTVWLADISYLSVSSIGRRNTSPLEVAMMIQKRRSDLSGRAKLYSPGRPTVGQRVNRQKFWSAIAAGLASEAAAVTAGISPPVGVRWFRHAGGLPPSHLTPSAPPLSGRYLSFSEREQIALLRAKGSGVRRSHMSWPEHHRRSRENYGAMPPRAVAAWSIELLLRNGMRNAPLGAQSQPSWRLTLRYEDMCRIG